MPILALRISAIKLVLQPTPLAKPATSLHDLLGLLPRLALEMEDR